MQVKNRGFRSGRNQPRRLADRPLQRHFDYNGISTSRLAYDTKLLSGVVPSTCGARGVVVQTYPSNGIQNGDPDGIALVNAAGTVVEFLSYEGVFTAAGDAASGMTSTDIGVREVGTETPGLSLQRSPDGTWSAPATSTFGACNDEDPPPPADVASVTPIGQPLQRYSDSDGKWFPGQSSFGVCNGLRPPPGVSTISITGRTGSDPALPVGFQDQVSQA